MANEPQQLGEKDDTRAHDAAESGATVVQHPAVITTAQAPPHQADEEPTVCPLKVDDTDERGNIVQYIYARDPHYIVYYSIPPFRGWRGWLPFRRGKTRVSSAATRCWEGVQAQLSSKPGIRQVQRKNLLPLGVERAKLQSLLRDWPLRQGYDSSIATALQMALDADGKEDDRSRQQALRILTDARIKLSREWDTRLRGYYAFYLAALGFAGFFILLVFQGMADDTAFFKILKPALVGATAGLVGAVLSIALGLRRRTIPLEIGWRGTFADCFLRLLIGAVSGGTLVLLLMTGLLPKLKTSQDVMMDSNSPAFVMLLGIVAGFVERLIPSLLEREGNQLAGSGVAKSGLTDPAAKHA